MEAESSRDGLELAWPVQRWPVVQCSLCPPFCCRAVEDESFWDGLEPVNFGGLPRLQDSVTVIG